MYEDLLELECAICVDCDTPFPCECGGNVGMPDVDPQHANTGVRDAMSAEQARLYNATYWKHGLALILTCDGSYELFDSLVYPRNATTDRGGNLRPKSQLSILI